MRSEERKKLHGEVFTPIELVNVMLDRVPDELWSDPTKTFCDPAGCGNGSFLVEIVRRKIVAGLTPLQALQTTYGVDIMPDNVREAHVRLLEVARDVSGVEPRSEWCDAVVRNVVQADALTYDMEFKERDMNNEVYQRYVGLLLESV